MILVGPMLATGSSSTTAIYRCRSCVYLILDIVVKFIGANRMRKLFQPVITDPIIMIIGLMLAGTAGSSFFDGFSYLASAVVIATVIVVSLFCKGFILYSRFCSA